MFCMNCGAKIKDGGSFCSFCGTPAGNQPRADRHCNICNAQIEDGKNFCTACGTSVTQTNPAMAAMKSYCRVCHAEIEDGKDFCTACGAPVNNTAPNTAPKTANTLVLIIIGVVFFLNIMTFFIAFFATI